MRAFEALITEEQGLTFHKWADNNRAAVAPPEGGKAPLPSDSNTNSNGNSHGGAAAAAAAAANAVANPSAVGTVARARPH